MVLPGQSRSTKVVFTPTCDALKLDMVARSGRLHHEFPDRFHLLRCVPRAQLKLVPEESLKRINDDRKLQSRKSIVPGPGMPTQDEQARDTELNRNALRKR